MLKFFYFEGMQSGGGGGWHKSGGSDKTLCSRKLHLIPLESSAKLNYKSYPGIKLKSKNIRNQVKDSVKTYHQN